MKSKFFKMILGVLLAMVFATCGVSCNLWNQSPGTSVEETKLKMNLSTLTLDVYDQAQLSVTGADGEVVWSSDNTSVVTVSETGMVSALKAGNAVVTASADGKTTTCRITVRGQGIAPMLVFVNEEVVIVEGTSLMIGASVTFKNQTMDIAITYETANVSVATVDENGVVTGVAAGETLITVTAVVNANLTLSDSILVTVRGIANI